MMQMHDVPDGEVKVVTREELAQLTMQGWKLVFSYQETTHEPCNETEPLPPGATNNGSSYGYNNTGTLSLTRYKPKETTYFVLHRGENEVIADLNAKIEGMGQTLSNERFATENARKELGEVKKKYDDLKNTSDFDAQRLKNVVAERDRFRNTSSKLEGDLAKVRTAIGERAFNEILPPAPKQP